MIKRTVRGVGYNSGGIYHRTEDGSPTKFYKLWLGLFNRCYADYQLERRPSYKGCSIDERWHDYQEFAKWCDEHEYGDVEYQIDKDILVKGNRVYSPDTCCFVPRQINMLFTSAARARGKFPQGVNYYEPLDKYCSRVRIKDKLVHLGYYDTPEQAYEVYKKAKETHVKDMADLWFGNIEPRVYEALMDWSL